MNRIGMRQRYRRYSMSSFVVSDTLLFIRCHNAAFLFQAEHDAIGSFFEITPTNISTNSDPEMEKGDTGFSSNSSSEKSFASAGRADKENTSRDAAAEAAIFAGMREEIDDFLQFGFGFVYSGEIGVDPRRFSRCAC